MESRLLAQNGLRSIITCVLICILFVSARAQYRVSSFLIKPPPLSRGDLLHNLPDSLGIDSAKALSPVINSKSPTTAVVLSAVLPGAGQIYAGRYWTVPIILGFGGYFAYEWNRMNNHYTATRAQYSASIMDKSFDGKGDPQLLYERDFYHDERDRFAFYLAITYLLNIVDAYVGASLYNFDVGDNLTGGASLKLSIPLN